MGLASRTCVLTGTVLTGTVLTRTVIGRLFRRLLCCFLIVIGCVGTVGGGGAGSGSLAGTIVGRIGGQRGVSGASLELLVEVGLAGALEQTANAVAVAVIVVGAVAVVHSVHKLRLGPLAAIAASRRSGCLARHAD